MRLQSLAMGVARHHSPSSATVERKARQLGLHGLVAWIWGMILVFPPDDHGSTHRQEQLYLPNGVVSIHMMVGYSLGSSVGGCRGGSHDDWKKSRGVTRERALCLISPRMHPWSVWLLRVSFFVVVALACALACLPLLWCVVPRELVWVVIWQ